jgi:hypothetical protein
VPDPIFYVIPETHTDRQDQERSKTLAELAGWDAINVLLESVLFHDTSGQGSNLYGIEEESSIRRANLLRHYILGVNSISNLNQKIQNSAPNEPLELAQARGTARAELTTLQQKGAVTKQATSQELAQYISNFPIQVEAEIQEKFIFYKRNHKMAENIRAVVLGVMANPHKPRVFVLSIGAKHIDSTSLSHTASYQGRKDLPTILGANINTPQGNVDIVYGNQTVATIAQSALERADSLPFMARMSAKLRLKVYTGLGL